MNRVQYTMETYPSRLDPEREYTSREVAEHDARMVARAYGSTLSRITVLHNGEPIYSLRYNVETQKWQRAMARRKLRVR